MTHLDPRHRASRRELRSFGVLVGGAFLAVAALLMWRSGNPLALRTLAAIGGTLAVAGLVAPASLALSRDVWMRFAVALSRFTTPIFMGAIYFVVLTPTGMIMRALGRNPLGVTSGESRWVTRPLGARASVLERQF